MAVKGKALFLILVLTILCSTVAGLAQEMKIASIDTGKILMAHPAFQKALEKYQSEVRSMQEKIKEMGQDEQMAARQMMQHQMQELGTQLESEAFKEMRKDVKKMAVERGYKYVMDSNVLIVGGDDITEDILAEIKKSEEACAEEKAGE